MKIVSATRWLKRQTRKIIRAITHPEPTVATFAEIYEENRWGGTDSRSGTGSDLHQTAGIRRELPLLLQALGVRSFLDAPCGDFHWMREVALPVQTYVGADLISALVARNNRLFGTPQRSFRRLDLRKDPLPKVDLILCRDCLVHLSFDDIASVFANFRRSGSTYLLTTTFTEHSSNVDIGTGDWRPLNLEQVPFQLPPPASILVEGCSEDGGRYQDKCLGLWRVVELPGKHNL